MDIAMGRKRVYKYSFLHPSAALGPIDLQINGLPARMIKSGFEEIKKRIDKEGVPMEVSKDWK